MMIQIENNCAFVPINIAQIYPKKGIKMRQAQRAAIGGVIIFVDCSDLFTVRNNES